MNWYFKSLGDGMWADLLSEEIKRQFLPLFEAAGQPVEMAVFTRHDEGDLHCEWFAYFSPAAAQAAQAVGASPCEHPLRAGLDLLAGSAQCWEVLFGNGRPTSL